MQNFKKLVMEFFSTPSSYQTMSAYLTSPGAVKCLHIINYL